MPVQGQTSPRGGNFRLARGDSMNKVIASASPAINAEGLDIWLLQVPELLVGFLIVVGTTGLAVLVSMAMWKSPRVAGKSPHSDAGDWLTQVGAPFLWSA